ncbi:hypothetical protein HMPREF3190_00189 [Umbribacter vaginalis]|nr:hypothetical protein HMPREF3190_00189 [Coriobacteriales bacterium DNF00809]
MCLGTGQKSDDANVTASMVCCSSANGVAADEERIAAGRWRRARR